MILLDTHVWIWWVHGDRKLPESLTRAIARHEHHGIAVSAISCWEVAKLVRLGKLNIRMDLNIWFEKALSNSNIIVLPISHDIAALAGKLAGFPSRDPGDELIIATAIAHDAKLATCDRLILAYPGVQCLKW